MQQCTARSWPSQRDTWRRRSIPHHNPMLAPTPFPLLAEQMRAACRAVPSVLAFPSEWTKPLGRLALDTVLEQRGGLPRLATALGGGLGQEPVLICYLGGSVTEQRNGYRPCVTKWLEATAAPARVRIEEVPAFCGVRPPDCPYVRPPLALTPILTPQNCGSKVLAFMVGDWVVSRRP